MAKSEGYWSVIHNSTREGKDCNEVRYYILSKYLSGKNFGDAVRQHWAVENNLHWQLDVTFNKDPSRIRKGHADTNFSILRRTALSMLKNEKTAEVGIKNKRFQAGLRRKLLGESPVRITTYGAIALMSGPLFKRPMTIAAFIEVHARAI